MTAYPATTMAHVNTSRCLSKDIAVRVQTAPQKDVLSQIKYVVVIMLRMKANAS